MFTCQLTFHSTLLIACIPSNKLEQIGAFHLFLNTLIWSSMLLRMWEINRAVQSQLVNIYCAQLRQYWPNRIEKKKKSICIFNCIFLSHIIGRIIVQSKFRMIFSVVQHSRYELPWQPQMCTELPYKRREI